MLRLAQAPDLRSLNLGREMEEITDPSKLTYDAKGLIPRSSKQP